MRELKEEIKGELRKIVYEFFAEECNVDINGLTDTTNIMDELDGDSLMFVELLQIIKKKYNLNIELQTIGKYLLKDPAETIGKIIEITYLLYQYENKVVDLV